MAMMDPVIIVPVLIVLLAVVFYLGWFLNSKAGQNTLSNAHEKAKSIISDAEKESKNIKREKILEVKDEWYKKKQEFDNEVNTQRQKLQTFKENLKVEKKT